MSKRVGMILLVAVLIAAFSLEASAGIGKVGPPEYSKVRQKRPPHPNAQFYSYLLPKNARHLGGNWYRIGRGKHSEVVRIMWELMPDPPAPKTKETAQADAQPSADTKQAPANNAESNSTSRFKSIPGLVGIPGLR